MTHELHKTWKLKLTYEDADDLLIYFVLIYQLTNQYLPTTVDLLQ